MRKLISLVCAVASTTFLLAGVTRAAEAFDGLARSAQPTTFSESATDGPGQACWSGDWKEQK